MKTKPSEETCCTFLVFFLPANNRTWWGEISNLCALCRSGVIYFFVLRINNINLFLNWLELFLLSFFSCKQSDLMRWNLQFMRIMLEWSNTVFCITDKQHQPLLELAWVVPLIFHTVLLSAWGHVFSLPTLWSSTNISFHNLKNDWNRFLPDFKFLCKPKVSFFLLFERFWCEVQKVCFFFGTNRFAQLILTFSKMHPVV